MVKENLFLSCDWGTSSFRLRLVEVHSCKVIAQRSNNQGINSIHQLWVAAKLNNAQRVPFYQAILKNEIRLLQQETHHQLEGVPLIVSGMASSTLGIVELPYKPLPFSIDGSDLQTGHLPATNDFNHNMLIISGVRSDDDVMRGEEIQLVGCSPDPQAGEHLFILPGTHSKHIKVENGKVVHFQTFMTGEMFDLLSTRSILAGSIEKGLPGAAGPDRTSFLQGVNDGKSMNPLHAFFLVRTNALFGKLTKQDNWFYLSGLLIGLELKDIPMYDCRITLLVNEQLQPYYLLALQQMGLPGEISVINVDQALLNGHCQLYQKASHSPWQTSTSL
ncbi:2-dehydro-3-deoxygalactonokinase [Segetibacter sp. 3557_3]|uniref:2-dehydro-3-deoxygalactonokinase n=1 Tax=Segetibacter sp. 3557_3 TaxID=2547429 RepID=UPI0014042F1B|nr:2-dehydro-3-deoxygalactonokinase [Segetibacter sp. 3557_3]